MIKTLCFNTEWPLKWISKELISLIENKRAYVPFKNKVSATNFLLLCKPFIPKMTSTIKKPFFVLFHSSTPLWRIGNTCPHKNLCTNVHSNTIYKSQRMGKTQTSINWQMDKQNVMYPYNRVLLHHKEEFHTCFIDKPQKHYIKWKKPNTKDHIHCDSIYMEHLE